MYPQRILLKWVPQWEKGPQTGHHQAWIAVFQLIFACISLRLKCTLEFLPQHISNAIEVETSLLSACHINNIAALYQFLFVDPSLKPCTSFINQTTLHIKLQQTIFELECSRYICLSFPLE